MEDRQDPDPALEAEGRRLLTAAFETGLAGHEWAGHEWAGAERLRRQVRRRISRRWRMRTLVPAGAVVVIGGAVALALALAATVADAPSALAAVTAAAAKTSAESFRVTSTMTEAVPAAPDFGRPPLGITGVFDPARGLGEEVARNGMVHIRIVDGNIYVASSRFASAPIWQWLHGKTWIASPVPWRLPVGFDLIRGFNGDEPIDPSALLGMLKSAASVQAEGAASGPGWTGTKYVFTERPKDAVPGEPVSGTVYVDNQGHVRRMVTSDTYQISLTNVTKATETDTVDVTFGDFGVRVSVTAPPASQVYYLRDGYLYINGDGGLVIWRNSAATRAPGLSLRN
jgi:hypothetical protein